MKRRIKIIIAIIATPILLGITFLSKLENIRIENYPGGKLPANIPEVFAPGIVSSVYSDFGITFSPDLSEIYFTRRGEGSNPRLGIIMQIKKVNGEWTEPKIAPFSGVYNDMEPIFTPDGNRLIFGSNRPQIKGEAPTGFLQWYVQKTDIGWSEPKILGAPFINRFVMYPTMSDNGNLYFTGEDGIYKSILLDGVYQEPVKLAKEINSFKRSAHSYIAADESYLIFDAQPRGDLKSDLFISFSRDDGSWTPALKLNKKINAAETQAIPMISPSGKQLFFVRDGDIYWVNTKHIPELNSTYIKTPL